MYTEALKKNRSSSISRSAGWVNYLWLTYLLSLPLNASLRKAPLIEWVAMFAGIAVFLPLYIYGLRTEGRRLYWVIGGSLLLGILFGPINPGAAVYFIYAAAFAGMAGTPRFALRLIGGILVILAAESVLLHLPVYFWAPGGVFTVLIGLVNIHYAQRERDHRKLMLAQDEVEKIAKIAERERIARDLHDVLGHTLSVIVLKSELASKLADTDVTGAVREIRDVERISRETLAQVRSTVRGYQARSIQAEIEGLTAALTAAGVEPRCDVAELDIPPSHEGVLALALREGVTNVIRHARANVCELRLRQEGDALRLEIMDDGNGRPAPEGIGLSSMRTRVEAMGGTLDRRTSADPGSSGTSLVITLPVALVKRP
jgi:two-component system, NarL family, sensor histidine kinase DesK